MTILLVEARLGDASLRPRLRPRPRRQNCRGNTGGGPQRSSGHRGLYRPWWGRTRHPIRRDGDAMIKPLLTLDRINTFYGAVQAQFDLSLEVGEAASFVAGRQRQRQIDVDESYPRPDRAALRKGQVRRRTHRRAPRLSGDPGGDRIGARGATHLPADDGAREPADGRLSAVRQKSDCG